MRPSLCLWITPEGALRGEEIQPQVPRQALATRGEKKGRPEPQIMEQADQLLPTWALLVSACPHCCRHHVLHSGCAAFHSWLHTPLLVQCRGTIGLPDSHSGTGSGNRCPLLPFLPPICPSTRSRPGDLLLGSVTSGTAQKLLGPHKMVAVNVRPPPWETRAGHWTISGAPQAPRGRRSWFLIAAEALGSWNKRRKKQRWGTHVSQDHPRDHISPIRFTLRAKGNTKTDVW